MEFRLTYDGALPSGSRGRVEQRQRIREQLHPQLAQLWKLEPLHSASGELLTPESNMSVLTSRGGQGSASPTSSATPPGSAPNSTSCSCGHGTPEPRSSSAATSTTESRHCSTDCAVLRPIKRWTRRAGRPARTTRPSCCCRTTGSSPAQHRDRPMAGRRPFAR